MVYLLHFIDDKGQTLKVSGRASHYLGYTPDERRSENNSRVQKHVAGRGSALTRWVVQELGGHVQLVAMWPKGDRKLERQLKNQHNHRRHCPICKAEAQNLDHLDELL